MQRSQLGAPALPALPPDFGVQHTDTPRTAGAWRNGPPQRRDGVIVPPADRGDAAAVPPGCSARCVMGRRGEGQDAQLCPHARLLARSHAYVCTDGSIAALLRGVCGDVAFSMRSLVRMRMRPVLCVPRLWRRPPAPLVCVHPHRSELLRSQREGEGGRRKFIPCHCRDCEFASQLLSLSRSFSVYVQKPGGRAVPLRLSAGTCVQHIAHVLGGLNSPVIWMSG